MTKPLVFVDSNILIAGLFEANHPAQVVVALASCRQIDLITCHGVTEDVGLELTDRAEERGMDSSVLAQAWQVFLQRINLDIVPDPLVDLVKETKERYLPVMRHLADIPVLASAIEIKPHLILSDNSKHFNQAVSERCGIPIMSSKTFVETLMKGKIQEQLDLLPQLKESKK